MVKKIVFGVILTALAVGLVYGGVYRTAARLETESEPRSQGQRNIKAQGEDLAGQSGSGSRSQGGNGRNDADGGNLQNEGQLGAESVSYDAVVVESSSESLLLRTENGTEILIEGRAWRYAQESGFTASSNQAIKVTGFPDENGKFEVSWISNLNTGVSVFIRDEGGRPNWAGAGNGNGNGRTNS